jgi:hypothetical protein
VIAAAPASGLAIACGVVPASDIVEVTSKRVVRFYFLWNGLARGPLQAMLRWHNGLPG